MAGMLLIFVLFFATIYNIAYDSNIILFLLRSGFCLPLTIISGILVSYTPLYEAIWINHWLNTLTYAIIVSLLYLLYGK